MADQVGVARVPPKYSIPGKGRHDPRLGALGKHKLPDGRLVDEVSGGELASILTRLNVSGASHENGREANARAYAAHLEKIGEAGRDKAVEEWLREMRNR